MHLGPLVQVSSNIKEVGPLRPPREIPSWTPSSPYSGAPGLEPGLARSPWISQSPLSAKTASEHVSALPALHARVSPDLSGAFPFLQLPGELRNLIYNFFIPQNQHLRLPLYMQAPRRSRENPHEVMLPAYSWKPIHPSILRISSQIRHEVLAHFYEKNTFEVHSTSLARFLDPIALEDRMALRSLVLKGGFYMLDHPEEDDIRMAALLKGLNLTRLHISAAVSLFVSDLKGSFDIRTLDVDEFILRSGMCALVEVKGLQKCTIKLEPSHMTRRTPELDAWLRKLEKRLEEALMSNQTRYLEASSSVMELC